MTYSDGCLRLIDQRLLPTQEIWVECRSLDEVVAAISDMVVRGAPAIGCTAAFGLHLHIVADAASNVKWGTYRSEFDRACSLLNSSRPTAVNLAYAISRVRDAVASFADDSPLVDVVNVVGRMAQELYDDDLATCKAIGRAGLEAVELSSAKLRVLTHCNTGSLATAGYGTALGVIRSLYEAGRLEHVYVDETRPYLQGARLTAFELQKDGIPFSLIVDSAAASLMRSGEIDMVVVGADRIAENGDTANKIGTYSVAVNARYHDIPFFVAAPIATFDTAIKSGAEIPIEMRNVDEVLAWAGHRVAPVPCGALNPSFDVTDAKLITAFITEAGVLKAPFTRSINDAKMK